MYYARIIIIIILYVIYVHVCALPRARDTIAK